jgi:hypothetical protein
MHLAYTNEFSGGQQTAGWLSEKATSRKSKFELDQKNHLGNLTRKGKAEEWKNAANHRQAVANASEQLLEAFTHLTIPPTNPENVSNVMQEKWWLRRLRKCAST